MPKTGQTTCYDPADTTPPIATIACAGTGQDGDLAAGVVPPNPRFTDNLNGTVTDNLTGLIWLKNANCPVDARNWATALTDVASLNSTGNMNSNSCGDTSNAASHQTDWRLPNRNELTSLLDLGTSDPALPLGHLFTTFQASGYWSSTTSAFNSVNAWVVVFLSGVVSPINKTSTNFVTAVRGGS